MADNEHKIEFIVNKYNAVGFINAGGGVCDALKVFNHEMQDGYKSISQMAIEEDYDHATYDEIQKNKEVLGVGTDAAATFMSNLYNQGTLTSFSLIYGDDKPEVKNINDDIKFLNKKEDLKESLEYQVCSFFKPDETNENWQNVVKYNGGNVEGLAHDVGLTSTELDRILGRGDFAPKNGKTNDMFDYGNNSIATEDCLTLDVSILDKLGKSDIKVNCKELFEVFKIKDGDGNVLKNDCLNKMSYAFLKCVEGLKQYNSSSWKLLEAKTKLMDAKRQMLHNKRSGNFSKVATRLTGMDKMQETFQPYTSQITKPLSLVKATDAAAEKSVKATYSIFKKISLFSSRVKGDEEAYLDKLEHFSNIEKSAYNVRHPIRSIFNKLGESDLVQKNALYKGKRKVGEKLSQVNKTIFGSIGKAAKPFMDILFKILKGVAFGVLLPLALILILVIMFGLAAESQIQRQELFAIMPVSTEDDFDLYQKTYDELDDNFMKSFENDTAKTAVKLNLKGEKIGYGINGLNNENGMENTDFSNGIYYKFITDDAHQGRSSNIEDVICMMAIMMNQNQNTYPDVACKIIEWLYNISHHYTYSESPLYACNSACHNVPYKCTDIYHDYKDSDIRFNPFHAKRMSGDDYEIKTPTNKCEVCSQFFTNDKEWSGSGNSTDCVVVLKENPTQEDYFGCITEFQCFHGSGGNMGRNHNLCNKYTPHYSCPGHEHNTKDGDSYTTYCSGEIGCEGHYECDGHDHYKCNGHNYKCCLGHTDLQANVEILFYEDVKNIINEYDFGDNDTIAKQLSEERN